MSGVAVVVVVLMSFEQSPDRRTVLCASPVSLCLQCIDSAVRDACDLGFLVTCVTDAVYTHSEERHRSALANNRGYCRQLNTARVVGELNDLKAAARSMSTSTTAPLQGQGSAPGNSEKSEQFPSPRLELQAQPEEARPVGPVVSAPREYVRFEIVDLNGKALSKVVPARHKDSRVYLYSGALALGANSEVLTVPEEVANLGCPNGLLIPFWETCRALPWAADAPGAPPGGVAVKRVFCEQSFMAKGQLLPNLAVPRTVCRRLLGELAQRGLRVLSATELEFCMVTAGEPAGYTRKGEEQGWKPLFGEGSCGEIFVTLSGTKTAGFQYAIEEAMEAIGVDVRTMNCEYGPAQLEITFGPALGIASPDAAVSFRTAVKEIAQQRGLCATFYSKPFGERGVGSGGHLNFSLWRAEASAEEPSSPWQGEAPHGFVPCTAGESPNALSPEAEAFLAGIIEHAPALEALCAPTPGCYGRHGNWAPTVANWGFDDRTAAIRVHADAHRGANECYAELRMPSSAANPYLVLAGMVAAGLDGVDRKCQLPPPGQTQADGASVLPKSLPEALDELIRDTQLCTRLGAALVEWFVGVKRAEIARVQEWTVEAMESPDGSRRAADTASMLALQRMYLEFV